MSDNTFKALFTGIVIGLVFSLLIFTVGTWAMTAFGERLHPDAVNIREMDAFRIDIKGDIKDLKESIDKVHDILLKK